MSVACVSTEDHEDVRSAATERERQRGGGGREGRRISR